MKNFGIFLLTIFSFAALATSQDLQTRFLNLPVDHFNFLDRRTFDLRYIINEAFYRVDGPVFIFINDGAADTRFIQQGNMIEVADLEGAVLITLEQRYHGSSLPTPDASTENLKWFTIHQIIADIGRFSVFIRNQYNNAPVIVWGPGRAGTLAVWARQKYPHAIDGAWGSSALLNAILEDHDFLPNTFNTIRQVGGDECAQVITDAFRTIEEAFQTGNTTFLEQRFNTCGPVDTTNSNDIARIAYTTAYDTGLFFLALGTYPEIDQKCRILLGQDRPDDPPTDPVDAFARWFVDDFHATRQTPCIGVSNELYNDFLRDPSWEGLSTITTARQRLWITCTQWGQWQTANDGSGHPFGSRFDMRFMQQWCVDVFGLEELFNDQFWMRDQVESINMHFGGLNPATYRLFITQGELDPFRSLGPQTDINPQSSVVVIPLNAYSRDLNAPDQSGDYTVLLETKLRIQETVREWIRYARYGEGATPY